MFHDVLAVASLLHVAGFSTFADFVAAAVDIHAVMLLYLLLLPSLVVMVVSML
jgi:hypothetical protein